MRTILVVILLICSRAAYAAETVQRIAGTYSNLSYHEEAGDLLGMEMFIVSEGHGEYKALVQVDEGGLGPVVLVPVQVDGNHISFRLPEPSLGAGSYEGEIAASGFRGTWTLRYMDGTIGKKPIRLKRKHSYWDN